MSVLAPSSEDVVALAEATEGTLFLQDALLTTHAALPARRGLRNLGNCAYMNAGLQYLASAAPLSQLLLSGDYKADLNLSACALVVH